MVPARQSDAGTVVFGLADRSGRLAGVRLAQHVGLRGPLDLTRRDGEWLLEFPRPDVDRMEYLFDVEDHNGQRASICDPANPLRAPGAFGEKSVLEFAGYRPPAWLGSPRVPAGTRSADAAGLDVTVWTPHTLAEDDAAPLLVVHDGPEYASLGGIADFAAASIAAGTLPPCRLALLGPGDRNAWYAADDSYARRLATGLTHPDLAPTTTRIGVGASLGALAMLHTHRRHPELFGGLFLQSGSFFTPELDAQEATFAGFGAVTRFVATVHESERDPHPVPTVLTCGTVEENLPDNRLMAQTLAKLGYGAALHVVRDAHNFAAWRDALAPHLLDLVEEVGRAS